MNKKFIFTLLAITVTALSSCSTSSFEYDPEVIKNNVVSKFNSVDSSVNRVFFEGVSNIFNRGGYEYRKTDYKYDNEKTKAHYLAELSSFITVNNWFAYKGTVVDVDLYLGDELNIIFKGSDTNYALTGVNSGTTTFSEYSEDVVPNTALNFAIYEGVGVDNAKALLETTTNTFLAYNADDKFYLSSEINEESSWNIFKEKEIFKIENVALRAEEDKILNFNETNKELEFIDNGEAIKSNINFFVTKTNGKKTIDKKTLYGALTTLFIIRGSFAKIAMEEITTDLSFTRLKSIDPVLEVEKEKENVTLPNMVGGLHISIKNASCMISLSRCHYVDGWTDVSSVWARWNVDLYFNNQGLLTYESISTNNYSSKTLKESIFLQGFYTYGVK
jgi:hypothetical protein